MALGHFWKLTNMSALELYISFFIWWQPTPVLLPGKFQGLRSLVGYSPWGHKEVDTTVWLTLCKILLFLRSLKILLHRIVEAINSTAEEKFAASLIHIFWVLLLFIYFKLCKLLETYFYSQCYELLLGHL